MVPEFHVEWSVFQHVLISLALGAIVGLERQSQKADDPQRSGIRTFALASLLGTAAALLYDGFPALSVVLGVGLLGFLGLHYFQDAQLRGKAPGITTETATMIVFALGALVPSRPLLSASVAVLVTVVLSQKKLLHQSVAKLTDTEVFATIKLLLVTVVFLPLLPPEPVDPWGIYAPRDIWFLVVLISAISFLGYFAMRVFGSQRGIAITGLLGGVASSTAVTLSMAERAKESRLIVVERAATFAIVAATTIMYVRVLAILAVVDIELARDALLPLGALTVAGGIVSGVLWLRRRAGGSGDEELDPTDPELTLDNPFRLGPAFKFAAVFVVIIGAVHVASVIWGNQGVQIASAIGGLAHSDATVITAARVYSAGDIGVSGALRATVLAVIANTVVKVALAWFLGTSTLARRVGVAMIPVLAVGGIVWLIV
jgi:uncharacterized membrane protein (DUF4010 family)